MAQGNYWQKQIAKLAIKKLTAGDEVGILFYDFTAGVKWHIPLQEIGDKREFLMRQVDKLVPGDMPDFDPGLKMAHAELTDPKKMAALLAEIPLHRMGQPEEIAKLAVFLASDAAAYVTGSTYVMDGGLSVNTGGL